ncbi:hypothetical protein FRB99_008942 [Tulasnella sp. 403]|nr:hypothetical protein FRB99_008942 [Tulasnella sp. 403]
MSQSYQRNANSGAEPNQPVQVPQKQAEGGIHETAQERPDISGDTGRSEKVDIDNRDEGEGEENISPPPDTEYPEQKHAGKVGYGPNYAETRGKVTLSEKMEGLKAEMKGKMTHNEKLMQKGHDKRTGQAKHREVEEGNNPGAFANAKEDDTEDKNPDSSEAGGRSEKETPQEDAEK